MSLDGIGREPDQFHPTFGEVGLVLGQSRELRGTHRGVVLGVREENGPTVANPLMEVDGPQRRLSLEVWCCRSQAETKRGQAASVSSAKLSREGTYGGARGASAILIVVFERHLFSWLVLVQYTGLRRGNGSKDEVEETGRNARTVPRCTRGDNLHCWIGDFPLWLLWWLGAQC